MRFDYLQPTDVADCLGLLAKHGAGAKIIAGGTDLIPKAQARVADPRYVVDVTGIAELCDITDAAGGLRIGAAVTVADVSRSPLVRERFPLLASAAALIGSVGIRNVATIGGNICNASPSSECSPALMCLSAEARIVGPDGERTVPIEEFFVGPGMNVLSADELLREIHIPRLGPHARGVYLKHSPRGSIDLATVGVAVLASFSADTGACEDVRIALGAVAPTPLRAGEAERLLRGAVWSDKVITDATAAAAEAARPIDDVRASAAYRRKMVGVFTGRALRSIRPA
jgi:CO/xanthine dehydrogenase FAD-binding subunit